MTVARVPLPEAVLEKSASAIGAGAGATVAGLGESTRFAHETFDVRDQIFRRLVRRYGVRALALQDGAAVGATLDAYVTGGPGTAESALEGAWRPWRTAEMAAALDWIRAFNKEHPGDHVRILGIKPAQAGAADYDAVLDYIRRAAPHRLAEMSALLEPIRSAHEIDEHVQRARGLHPGRPFVEHARDALAIVEDLPEAAVLERMRLIVDFHERSVAGRGAYAGDAEVWAETIIGYQRRTGHRVAYWDGIAHTSATATTLGLASGDGPKPTVGSVLRRRYGRAYVSVAIGFHHGDLGIATVPAPPPDWLDARLSSADQSPHWLDLRSPTLRPQWSGPAKARVISGIYTPAQDAAEHLTVPSLPTAFDILIHIPQVTPVQSLDT